MQSRLVFDVCWVALSQDRDRALDILHAASCSLRQTGGQLHEVHAVVSWLGQLGRLYGEKASNAARFTNL